jgi:hypothetical protein
MPLASQHLGQSHRPATRRATGDTSRADRPCGVEVPMPGQRAMRELSQRDPSITGLRPGKARSSQWLVGDSLNGRTLVGGMPLLICKSKE